MVTERTLRLPLKVVLIMLCFALVIHARTCASGTRLLIRNNQQIARIRLAELMSALRLFSYDAGRYPTTAEGLEALLLKPSHLKSWGGPYMRNSEIPKDPWGRLYL